MGKPAARIGDMHVCPMVTGVVPHVGGPVIGPGVPTVLIGGMPAVTLGDMCTCVGPPDSIILGSMGVMIGGKPAARMGDSCAHGGTIVLGCMTVLIGDINVPSVGGGGMGGGISGAVLSTITNNAQQLPVEAKVEVLQTVSMIQAAESGTPLAHDSATCPICSKNS